VVKVLNLADTVHSWLISSLNDPIVKIISQNSHLTKTQLETLLIDVFADNIAAKTLHYDEKAHLRLIGAQISRGSFNRTLIQARKNVTKSIYTVILLGYLGLFDTTILDPYLEISNKLKIMLEAYKDTSSGPENPAERLKLIETMRKELENSLKDLTSQSTVQV
jgi:hypothetical protein